MFRRFYRRTGYDLRRRLPDLFFDVSPDSARVRHDFYTAITDFYSDAYYRQIHDWCSDHGVLFTGHLLYGEGLRQMIRVEGNLFRHYEHLDVVGVDHLYPIVGTRDLPAEHVAVKVASSAAHRLGSERLLCESFGGIFMDATMQRMKWVTDWEYVLGVNLLNPHGFHYTLEGPRKRDWPPSMFYQYPWWRYYGAFSDYVSRLSHLLSGGRHVAPLAVIWPINALFAVYRPQVRTPVGDRIENDFNALTDLLLRAHHDFDYVDESVLAGADTAAGVLLPGTAFGDGALVDVRDRVGALFGVAPGRVGEVDPAPGIEPVERDHPGGGRSVFLSTASLARALPECLQRELGQPGVPESGRFVVEPTGPRPRHLVTRADGPAADVTAEVEAERAAVLAALEAALARLVEPDVEVGNPEDFALHRVKDDHDVVFLANPTFELQPAVVGLPGAVEPELWDPSTGERRGGPPPPPPPPAARRAGPLPPP